MQLFMNLRWLYLFIAILSLSCDMTRALTTDDGFCTKEKTVFDRKSIGSMLKTENQIPI